jgi:hypothetical protein
MSLASQESKRNLASAWQCKTHTSLKTLEVITKFGWTVLPHPSYSPDLAASNFHLFKRPEECSTWYKVWHWWWCDSHCQNLATRAGQGVVLTTHT